MSNQEIFRDIEGYEGLYRVSNYGRVKSLNGRSKKPIILKQTISVFGYCRVGLQKEGLKILTPFVHKLVAKAFIPNPENKTQVNHKDGNKSNNHVENLEWCTFYENIQHSYNNGLHKKVSKFRKLSKNEVIEIIKMREQNFKYKDIAKRFNTTPGTAYNIANRKTYKSF